MLKKLIALGIVGYAGFITGVIKSTVCTVHVAENADKSEEDRQKFLSLQQTVHEYTDAKERLKETIARKFNG